jgi:DNA-binding CsgD family transcriptional regulator
MRATASRAAPPLADLAVLRRSLVENGDVHDAARALLESCLSVVGSAGARLDGAALARTAAAFTELAAMALVTGDAFIAPASVEGLTGRERDVLRLLARGNTNRQIAALLGLSTRTVESHRANLMAKLGLASRVELVSYAEARGLL